MPRVDVPPQQVATPEEIAALVRFAGPFNYAGNPSVIVGNGFNDEGLPLSMQFIGRHGDEATLIRTAAAYESATDWHRQRPPL
jgi:Asp-tRNA(Asn)/Glu-tRNA(Gln) amidotransferase A subunit family amidase